MSCQHYFKANFFEEDPMKSNTNIVYSIPWNLFLITLGSVIVAVGIKAAIIPHGMITGGFSGLGLLCYYGSDILTPGIWYLILNVPVFIIGWKFISKRFLYYSLYGAGILTLFMDFVNFSFDITDPWLAALAGGDTGGGRVRHRFSIPGVRRGQRHHFHSAQPEVQPAHRHL